MGIEGPAHRLDKGIEVSFKAGRRPQIPSLQIVILPFPPLLVAHIGQPSGTDLIDRKVFVEVQVFLVAVRL